jgi:cob(I)alamin adenosyltransferase
MGELATLPEDLPRYLKDGFKVVTEEMTARLDRCVHEIEAQKVSFKGWATPGATLHSATLDVARTTCRRAERNIARLRDTGGCGNDEILVYLNRLSDALWLMARWVESKEEAKAG